MTLTWAGPRWIRPDHDSAAPGPSGQALQGLCEQGPRPPKRAGEAGGKFSCYWPNCSPSGRDLRLTCDPTRSCEPLDQADLERLGRLADAELDEFFARNPRLAAWRGRVRFIALAQGGAEHYLRRQRGIWDLDIIICFAYDPTLPRLFRRNPTHWDWGPSKFGRCPYDDPSYTGRAVDVMLWVIPDRPDPIEGLREWLSERVAKKPNAIRTPDLAHEPVVLIRPERGRVVWDPPSVPPPRDKTEGHRVTVRRAPA
jgi:hypothetical protein